MFKQSPFPILFASVLTIALLGCSPPVRPTPTPLFVLPTRVFLATPTNAAPTILPTVPLPEPSTTPTPAASTPTSPTRTPTAATGTLRVKIFLVALNDNGKSGKKIGCNDSVVSVERNIPATQTPLAAAINELLSIRDRNYGQSGLYNALYQSNLRVDSVTLVGGKATVHLSGKIVLGGVCDNPRFKAQIEETALQFSTVKQVDVMINNIPIDKVLSEKGGP